MLAYAIYSGTRDMTGLIEQAGLMAAALCASMDTVRLEDWSLDQIDRGIDVLVNNKK